jgi:hypothetical protein
MRNHIGIELLALAFTEGVCFSELELCYLEQFC